MGDIFEEAADLAGVPDELREEVIREVKTKATRAIAEEMHHWLVWGECSPESPS